MKKVYIVRRNEEYDFDFVAGFDNLNDLANFLHDSLADDYVFIKVEDIKKHIIERENNNNIYLFFVEDLDKRIDINDYRYEYIVQAIDLNQK